MRRDSSLSTREPWICANSFYIILCEIFKNFTWKGIETINDHEAPLWKGSCHGALIDCSMRIPFSVTEGLFVVKCYFSSTSYYLSIKFELS